MEEEIKDEVNEEQKKSEENIPNNSTNNYSTITEYLEKLLFPTLSLAVNKVRILINSS